MTSKCRNDLASGVITAARNRVKVLSWNVNGVRSIAQKGFFNWLDAEKPNVLCLQETKAKPDQLDASFLAPFGYQTFWHSAQKPGYSGVAIYTNQEPIQATQGIGIPDIDDEGRVLTLDFGAFTLINAYFPNSQREHTRLPYKLNFCSKILDYCQNLRRQKKNIILCGDYNIAHKEIDLKNPKTNQDNAGFLPQERAWMDQFIGSGYIDTFRNFCSEPDQYSWWSYRPGIRERNIGWRIDYHCINKEFLPKITNAYIMPQVGGSDHCPVGVELNV